MNVVRYRSNPNSFADLSPDSAYWIGFLFADGNVQGNVITLELSSKDRAHLDKFKTFTLAQSPIHDYGTCSKVTITSGKMVDDLAGWGVVPNKTFVAEAHKSLVSLPDFWRGVIDGDGSLYYNRQYLFLDLCGSKRLCEQYLDYLKTVRIPRSKVRKHASIYRVTVSAKHYTPAIYGNDPKYYLDRKMALAHK